MADYGELGTRTLGEVGRSLVTEGAGVVGGLLAAGFLGRQIQNRVTTDADVLAAPTIGNMAKAWAANNGPKIALWYLMRKYDAGTELTADAKKAVMGSVALDTLVRVFNKGVNPLSITIGGYEFLGSGVGKVADNVSGAGMSADVQHIIQENKALRAELNKAYEKAGLEQLPTPEARRKTFGSMEEESTLQTPRQRRFGAMYAESGGSGLADLSAKFGML